MKLIVDIPEEVKQEFDKTESIALKGAYFDLDGIIGKAIQNGIPLPKGHGRLIDEKDLSLMTVHLIDGVLVCDAPTIIEADKAESEEVRLKRDYDSFMSFDSKVWDSPYQKGGEEK